MISEEYRLNARINISKEIDAIRDIALMDERTKYAVHERLSLATEGFAIMKPEKNLNGGMMLTSIWKSSPDVSAQNLKILPYFTEDGEIHSEMAKMVTDFGGTQGHYEPEMHLICVNVSSGETLRYQAHCFIHELGHALAAKREFRTLKPATRPRQDQIAEEAEMRTLDYKLLLVMGGRDYQRQADDFARKITLFCTGQQKVFPTRDGKGVALDHCWGTAPSSSLAKMRDGLFSLYCHLMSIDSYYCNDPKTANRYKQDAVAKGFVIE